MDNITTVIADYGFPIIASFGLGYCHCSSNQNSNRIN